MLSGLPISKVVLGGVALTAAAGVGAVSHYYASKPTPSAADPATNSNLKKIELPGNRMWLYPGESNIHDGEWKDKVFNFDSWRDSSLDGYSHKKPLNEQTTKENIRSMKSACEKLMNGEFSEEELEKKGTQAKIWCTIEKKIKDMLEDKKVDFLGFDKKDSDEKEIWEKKLEKYKEWYKNKKVEIEMIKDWDETKLEEKKDEYIKALKERCNDISDEGASDNGKNVETFKVWCMKEKTNP